MARIIADTARWGADDARRWRGIALLLILGATIARIVYLANNCPLDLVPDEAHYWDWSRHLDWSYYSKGPLVAWLIRASCELFGPLSQSLTGSEMLAVRLPAVLSGGLLLVGLYLLTVQVFRDERLAFLVVIGAMCQPIFALGSLLMTIDAPFSCCWAWALVTGHRAVVRGERWAWPVTGLLIGIGILAKYTMLLWLFSLGLFLLLTPGFRELLATRRFWSMVGIAAFCCLPILIWNWQNDWVSVRHVAVQAGVPTAQRNQGLRWWGPFEYVGTQFGILLGYWFVVWVAGMIVFRPSKTTDPGIRYLWWLSLPTFVVFGVVTFKSAGQPNWPIATYLAGIPLGAAWLQRQITCPAPAYRGIARFGLGAACGLGILGILLLHDSEPMRPAMAKVVGPPTETNPFPIRKLDPTCRLRGWKFLAAEVDRVREKITRDEGTEPLLAAVNWTLPGELGFYCANQPKVFSLGIALGERHSQYDLWGPNPVADAQAFRGRTFVYVGPVSPSLTGAFDSIEPMGEKVYFEGGRPISGWSITVCRGFRGFPVSGSGGRTY